MRQLWNLWFWLTRPAPHISQADQRRHAHLLASMLLTIVPLGLGLPLLLSLNPTARELIGGPELSLVTGIGLFAIIPYLLNRRGHTQMAARLTVYFVALAIYIVALDPANPQGSNSLIRLLLPVIIGAILLSQPELVVLVSITITATLIYPLLMPQITLMTVLAGPLVFLVVGSALIIIFAHHRNRVEADRQQHLIALETRYRHMFDAAFDMILIHRNGQLLDANQKFAEFFGRELQTGLALADLLAEPLALQANKQVSETQIRRQDGSTFFAEMVTVDQIHEGESAQVTALRDVSRARRVEHALRESESRFRAVADSSPDFIYLWERQGERLPYFNQDGFLGYTREELVVPGYLASVTHPDDWSLLQAHWQGVLQGTTDARLEYRVRHNQGHWEWLERWATILTRDADDQPEQIMVTMRIITDRKQAAERYRVLYDNTPVMMHSVDQAGRIVEVNNHWLRVTGYTRQEVLGRRTLDFFTPESRRFAIEEALPDFFDTDFAHDVAFQLVKKNGTIMDVSWTATSERDADGQMISALTFMTDITERKQAETILRANEHAIRELYRISAATDQDVDDQLLAVLGLGCERFDMPVGVLTTLHDNQLEIKLAQAPAALFVAGDRLSTDSIYGQLTMKSDTAIGLAHGAEAAASTYAAHAQPGIEAYLGTCIRVNGVIVGTLFFASQQRRTQDFSDHAKDLLQLMARWVGTTLERVEAADQLRQSEARFRAIWENATDVLTLSDPDGQIIDVNSAVEEVYGYSTDEIIGQPFMNFMMDVNPEATLKLYRETFHIIEPGSGFENEIRHRDGSKRIMETRISFLTDEGERIALLSINRDITERKQAEADLLRRERENHALLEAIPDLIIRLDRDGRYLQVWPSKKPVDYRPIVPAEELVGMKLDEMLPPDVAQPLMQIIDAVLDDGEMRQNAYRLLEHGVWRYYEASWVRYNPNEVLATIRDVTDRHLDEARLRREASIFQNLVEAIIITEYIEGEFRIQSVNRAAEEMYGWQAGEAIGEFFVDIIQPTYPNDETRHDFKQKLIELGHWKEEQIHHRRDGQRLHVLSSITLLRDDNGDPSGAVTVVLDITRRKQAEHNLYLTEARLQSALRSASIVVSNQDTDLRYTWIHMPAHNFDSSQIIGKRDKDLMEQPDDAVKVTELKQQVITSGTGVRREVQVWERGAERVYDLSVEPLCDEDGRVIGITCVQVDMTERVQAEQARQKIQHLLQTVISTMPIVVWATDYDGTITLSEGMGLHRINQEPGEVVGDSIFTRYADYPELLNNMRRALAGEASTVFHETDGIQYQTHYHPAYNQRGRVVGLLGVTIDMTERATVEDNRLQLALERERIELIQRFVGDVSHDFRTPLTSIKLSTHLLSKAQTEADRLRHASVIERQAIRLERLMGDLFNMSRLDTATTNEYDFGSVNLNDMLNDIIAAHEVFVQEHGHSLIVEFDDNLPQTFGDRLQLDRVFTNLLINAVNYTPQGGTITIRTHQQALNLIIGVSDTGIGIAKDKLDLIFNRFYRGDPARGTDAGGMGVGLAIARKIIEAHGGQIEVDSEPEVGSTFRVSLPQIRGETS